MRCPQCGEILWATIQTREIVSAYCEHCEEVWEWNRPQRVHDGIARDINILGCDPFP